MRTIYITDGQIDMIERSLNEGAFSKVVENKVPSAQDQVKGKVNAGIMDGVTGCGMMEEEMLCENQSDKLANDYVKNTIGVKNFQDIRNYIFQICHAIPNVRFNKRYYLLGVIRLVYEEKLRGKHLSELNNILYNIRERNDILDRNLDGLSFMDLREKYFNAEDTIKNVPEVEKIRKTPTGYIIKHIESYEESYNSGPQDWCITYEEEYYYLLVEAGDCIYIVENPELMNSVDMNSKEFKMASDKMVDPTLYDLGEYGSGEPPYDIYGLSRFVVLVNPSGTYVYSRWNIPDDLDGHFLNREELEDVIGMPFNEAFPYVKPMELDDEIEQKYALRESAEDTSETPTIEGITKDADSFKDAFKPIADFMKSEGLNVYPFPDIELKWDEQDGLFIKTGYYLPSEKKIVLFCKDRHPKDILRSYAHEMIHHMQNLNGDDLNFTSEDDVKDNDKLEKLESEAYLKGNIYFRKWTEYERSNKNSILNENILKESPDSIENSSLFYNNINAYPFIAVKGFPDDILVGNGGSTHMDIVGTVESDADEGKNTYGLSQGLFDAIKSRKVKLALTLYYEFYGRYWSANAEGGNIISLWNYDENNYSKAYSNIVRTVRKMQDEGIEIDLSTLDFDDWKRKSTAFRYPVTWLKNGIAEIFIPRARKITKEKDFYIIFFDNGQVLKVNREGDVVGEPSPSYVNENIDESLTPSEVDLSSFNIKKELNPKFWKNDRLDSRIRMKLLDIADDFINFLGVDWVKPEDITITGSLANYNWNQKYSDIDLHIIMDYSKVDERTDFVDKYFYSQKKLWNEEHKELKIYGFPVEVYVQDINKKHTSSGVYSLAKDKWLTEPERDKLAKKKVNKIQIKNKVSEYTKKIDKLTDELKKSKGNDYKLRKISESAEKLFDELKNLRSGDLSIADNEINEGNIIFKCLRRLGYIEKINDIISKGYNRLNSLP